MKTVAITKTLNAAAAVVWKIVARASGVEQWFPLIKSCELRGSGEGATRICTMEAGKLEEPQEGLPSFISSATNRWTVRATEVGCIVRTEATFEVRGLMRALGWLLAWQMTASGARVLDELKHRVERGMPHPRKLEATASAP